MGQQGRPSNRNGQQRGRSPSSQAPEREPRGGDDFKEPGEAAFGGRRGHGDDESDDARRDRSREDLQGSFDRQQGPSFFDEQRRAGRPPYTESWPTPGPHSGRGPKAHRRSDERIREDVCDRLERHGQIDASEIDVAVSEGIVTLEGSVADRRAKRLAEEVAETALGVHDVMNRLKVDGSLLSKLVENDGLSEA